MRNVYDPNPLWRTAKPGSTLERSLALARDRGPTADQLRELESKVLRAVGAAAAVTATAAAVKASVASPLTVATAGLGASKLAVLVLVTAAASGTAVGVFWSSRPASTSGPSPGRSFSSARSTPAPARPSGAAVSPPLGVIVRTANVLAPPVARVPDHSAPRPAPARPVARARSSAAVAATPPPASDFEELQLLSRARRALASEPALALALAEQHARRFARGAMDQEREVIAVDALVGLGRLADARRRVLRFAREHSGSVYVGRMQEILSRGARSE